MAPKDPTSSPEPSARAGMRKGAKSKRRGRKPKSIPWEQVKVFDKPLLRTAFGLGYKRHRNPGTADLPPDWVRLAVESGLAEMAPYDAEKPVDGLLGPIDPLSPPESFNDPNRKSFNQILIEGLERAQRELLEGRPKKPDETR